MPNPNTCLTCHYSLGHTAPTSLGRCTVPLPPTTPPTHLDKTRGDYVCALWARKVKAVQTPPERFPTPGWENDTARGSGRTTRQLKEAVSWLADYAEATNDIGVINQDYPKVVDCLKRSGFVVYEFVGEPLDSFTADRTGRWLIGQAMHQMENLNMPPHENMVGIFSERYFTMLEDENNG